MTAEQAQQLTAHMIERGWGFSLYKPEGDETWRMTFVTAKVANDTIAVVGEFCTENDVPAVIEAANGANLKVKIGWNK